MRRAGSFGTTKVHCSTSVAQLLEEVVSVTMMS